MGVPHTGTRAIQSQARSAAARVTRKATRHCVRPLAPRPAAPHAAVAAGCWAQDTRGPQLRPAPRRAAPIQAHLPPEVALLEPVGGARSEQHQALDAAAAGVLRRVHSAQLYKHITHI
jgi:hypothetical protein